jgi:hypothetical protein
MQGLRALRAASKRNNTFVLLSLADAVSNDMCRLPPCSAVPSALPRNTHSRIKLNALILFEPLHIQVTVPPPPPPPLLQLNPPPSPPAQREQHRLACASLFKFPNASAAWCPRNLSDISLTAAYYNQVQAHVLGLSCAPAAHARPLTLGAAVPRRCLLKVERGETLCCETMFLFCFTPVTQGLRAAQRHLHRRSGRGWYSPD